MAAKDQVVDAEVVARHESTALVDPKAPQGVGFKLGGKDQGLRWGKWRRSWPTIQWVCDECGQELRACRGEHTAMILLQPVQLNGVNYEDNGCVFFLPTDSFDVWKWVGFKVNVLAKGDLVEVQVPSQFCDPMGLPPGAGAMVSYITYAPKPD